MPELRVSIRAPSLRWRASMVAVLATLLLQTGCDEYRISMRVRGKKIERTVSLWNQGHPRAFGDALATRLASVYGEQIAAGDHAVTGTFSHSMPQDVGGAGSYSRIGTPLGSANVYLERFRGTDDLSPGIEDANARIERLSSLIAGWIEAQLADDPDAQILARFVRDRIRPDLKNLNFYYAASQIQGDPRTAFARMFLYLEEREYLSVAELPQILRRLDDDEQRFALDYVVHLAARQIGVSPDAPIPDKLGFLSDPQRLSKSLQAYTRSTDEFQRWVADHPEVKKKAQLGEYLDSALLPPFPDWIFGNDRLRVALELPEPPIASNGTWNAETRRVEWTPRALPGSEEASTFVYATWTDAAANFQEAHFGRVALRGEALSDYAFAYAGLTPSESDEWDAFVGALEPGENLLASLRGFRFSDEPLVPGVAADEQTQSRAAHLIRTLTKAIEKSAGDGPPPEEGEP